MQTIDQLILESCERSRDRCALQFKNGLTWQETRYAELAQTSAKIASSLRSLGIEETDHVALLGPSSPRWVAAYLGILRNSSIVIPVDKELKTAELRHILADSAAKLIFVGQPQLEILLEIFDSLPQMKKIILLDADPHQLPHQNQRDLLLNEIVSTLSDICTSNNLAEAPREMLARLSTRIQTEIAPDEKRRKQKAELLGIEDDIYRRLRDKQKLLYFEELDSSEPPQVPSHNAEDCAVILYTSGTTGRSKGAMLSHRNIVSNIQGACKAFQMDERIHTLSFLPINHVFEQVCGILLPLSLGGKITFAESIKKLGENLYEIKPSFLLGVPAVYRLLYNRIMKNINNKTVSRLLFKLPVGRKIVTAKIQKVFGRETTFVSGGAALDPAIANGFQALGLNLLQGYGITETSPVIAAETPDRRKAGSVGLPIEGVEVQIKQPNEEGAGEILVKGPNVMLGYYQNEHATREVLTDGWYHTGDLGIINPDGMLSICGRVKNLIVTPNGKNVYPEEVENQLSNSPYIAEIMVYGHKVSATAEEVHASIFPCEEALFTYQQEQNKGPLSPQEVEALIRQEVMNYGKDLADYKRVKKFRLREDEFPKTTTRKIKRYVAEPEISTSE